MLGAILAKRAVRQSFKVLNNRDADGAVAGLAEDAVMEYPGDSALSGKYAGKEAIHKRMVHWFNQKDKVRFTLHNIAVDGIAAMGATNNVIVEWTLDTDSISGTPVSIDGTTVFVVKSGKVRVIKDYLYDPAQATLCYGPKA